MASAHLLASVPSYLALATNSIVEGTDAKSDEDTIMDHADFDCLSWKKILSVIDDYYKMILFLVEKNVLISPNYILPEAIYYVVFRYVIYQDISSGRRGRMVIERQVEIKSA
jgi:hypothetical protein